MLEHQVRSSALEQGLAHSNQLAIVNILAIVFTVSQHSLLSARG